MTDRRYEVRVAGLVPNALLTGLGDVEVATQELRTVLSGLFTDQAALHGFLHRLRARWASTSSRSGRCPAPRAVVDGRPTRTTTRTSPPAGEDACRATGRGSLQDGRTR